MNAGIREDSPHRRKAVLWEATPSERHPAGRNTSPGGGACFQKVSYRREKSISFLRAKKKDTGRLSSTPRRTGHAYAGFAPRGVLGRRPPRSTPQISRQCSPTAHAEEIKRVTWNDSQEIPAENKTRSHMNE